MGVESTREEDPTLHKADEDNEVRTSAHYCGVGAAAETACLSLWTQSQAQEKQLPIMPNRERKLRTPCC